MWKSLLAMLFNLSYASTLSWLLDASGLKFSKSSALENFAKSSFILESVSESYVSKEGVILALKFHVSTSACNVGYILLKYSTIASLFSSESLILLMILDTMLAYSCVAFSISSSTPELKASSYFEYASFILLK